MVEVSIRARGMRALLVMLLLGAWLPLQAATPLGDVASPDGTLQVEMALDDDGRPTWRLLRQGREVVAPSPLGMVGEGVDLSRGLAFAGVDPVQPVADDYELLSGKRRHNQYRANRRVFHWKDAQGHALAVAWQVSNDGAAFRYELARAVPGLETWKRDAASFRLPMPARGCSRWPSPRPALVAPIPPTRSTTCRTCRSARPRRWAMAGCSRRCSVRVASGSC
jgi:alpha-glucosidase